MPKPSPIELDFSRKYDFEHSQQYLHKHQDGLARRLSHWRDVQVARRALQMADKPNLVLDLPCGAGRFWPMLCEQPNRVIFAADNSADMIATKYGFSRDDVDAYAVESHKRSARSWAEAAPGAASRVSAARPAAVD